MTTPTATTSPSQRLTATAAAFTPAPAAFTPAPAAVPVNKPINTWTVEEVEAFFKKHNFPTAAIQPNNIDGESLKILCAMPEAEAKKMFCDPAPDGFAFTEILYIGRFKKEMWNLNVAFEKPYKPPTLPQRA
jgi:hypothetical protein